MAFILWLIAVVLVVWGVVRIIRGITSSNSTEVIWGVGLILLGCLVGPGGVSLFDADGDGVEGALTSVRAFIGR